MLINECWCNIVLNAVWDKQNLKGCLRTLLRIAFHTNEISISTPEKNCNANENLHLFSFMNLKFYSKQLI